MGLSPPGQAAKVETGSRVAERKSAMRAPKRPKPCSTPSISLATCSVSEPDGGDGQAHRSAASAVSSTAAVIMVTVWAWISIAARMRLARASTSSTVALIELDRPRPSGRLLDRGDLVGDVVGLPARSGRQGSSLPGRRPRSPRPASPAQAASMVAVKASQVGLSGDVADQAEDRSIASTCPDSAWPAFYRLVGLIACTCGDAGGDLDLGPGILDGPDQAGHDLRRLAHRHRRLLRRRRNLARLAQHAGGGACPGQPGCAAPRSSRCSR